MTDLIGRDETRGADGMDGSMGWRGLGHGGGWEVEVHDRLALPGLAHPHDHLDIYVVLRICGAYVVYTYMWYMRCISVCRLWGVYVYTYIHLCGVKYVYHYTYIIILTGVRSIVKRCIVLLRSLNK